MSSRVDAKPKTQCSGCAFCVAICPQEAISMIIDVDGFMYPSIDNSKCVECGLCLKLCPYHPNIKNHKQEGIYIARVKDINTLNDSASGGIFSALSDTYFPIGYVYGAAYDEHFQVHHIESSDTTSRNRMRDSKYVQSTINEVYKKIENRLLNGNKVLFSGTPCQCAAISEYVRIKKLNRANIIIVDIICHGVGSPKLWGKYLDYIVDKYDIGEILSIKTRNKEKGKGYNMTIYGTKGYYYKKGIEDPYVCLFNKTLIFRSSCFKCPFKSWSRVSDITIGDFQKVTKYYPEYADQKGISVILANTIEGKQLVKSILPILDWKITTKEQASQVNLSGLGLNDKDRNQFYFYCTNHSFSSVLSRYTNEGFFNRVIYLFKEAIKRLVYG